MWIKNRRSHTTQRMFDGTRSELVKRLLADTCEMCGSKEDVEVHHIRKLADLNTEGRPEKPAWVKRMAAPRRKCLSSVKTVMMPSTQDDQHGSFLGLVTGEPRETETLMRGSEAGRQKSALQGNSLAA